MYYITKLGLVLHPGLADKSNEKQIIQLITNSIGVIYGQKSDLDAIF